MILSGLHIAIRHARKFKIYALINIGGLGLAFASAIAILHFVTGEFSYDDFHLHPEDVYRLNTVTHSPSGLQLQAAATPLLAPTLMMEFPEVLAAVRLRHADDALVEIGEEKFYETKVFYADSNFFKVLTFPLAKGDPSTSLAEINTAVVTTEFAERYFKDQDPMNKTIKVENHLVEIRGVTAPISKSHFEFDILISFETFTPPKGTFVTLTSWLWTSFPTYVRLRNGTDAKSVEHKFPALISKYRSQEDAKKVSYQLQPIQDVYLHSRDIYERDGISTKGDYTYTLYLAAIAGVIMCVACFNFGNISTALSIYRIKETGIRRTLGSRRAEIFAQFIFESVLYAAVSFLLAIIVLQTGVTTLEYLLNTKLTLTIATHLKWFSFYLVLVLLIGSIGGLYPAIFLSSLKPHAAMKGKNAVLHAPGNASLKKLIIVFQFFATTALIAASLSIKRQIDFVQSKDAGYNKEGVIILRVPDAHLRKLYPTLRNKFTENTSVLGVSASRDMFDGAQGNTDVEVVGSSEAAYPISMFRMYPNFIETMGIEIVAGKTFADPLRDSTSFVLNEAATKMLGWGNNDAIGKRISSYGQTGEVIGVTKDFHFSSLHSIISPLIMLVPKSKIEFLYVRLAPGNRSATLAKLESDFKTLAPDLPFDFTILDEHVAQLYQQDKRLSRMIFVFSGLSVALACLGLYGIISLMAEARTKEIGIRKVLGASLKSITTLLSGQLMILVLIAAVIALPTSYYFLDRWLSDFAYRIAVPIDLLFFSSLLSTLLAGIAVSFKSIASAMANPVDSLKTE
jgi:putative ABC transport system permease protein